jgi:hypothetical protein
MRSLWLVCHRNLHELLVLNKFLLLRAARFESPQDRSPHQANGTCRRHLYHMKQQKCELAVFSRCKSQILQVLTPLVLFKLPIEHSAI